MRHAIFNHSQGVTTRRTRRGVEVVRIHYTADPERDSEWAKLERRKYSSQAAWDREQVIVHEAGGGELLLTGRCLLFVRVQSGGHSESTVICPHCSSEEVERAQVTGGRRCR